eukprot:364270-Chlamydomonas_euryale.AAC.5
MDCTDNSSQPGSCLAHETGDGILGVATSVRPCLASCPRDRVWPPAHETVFDLLSTRPCLASCPRDRVGVWMYTAAFL